MRKLLRTLLIAVAVLVAAVLIVSITPYAYLIKGVQATYLDGVKTPHIDDKEHFRTHLVRAEHPKEWPTFYQSGFQPMGSLDSLLEAHGTVAVAVFQNDTLLYEEYTDGYSETSRTNSFSMAKTVVAILTEMAIESGYIDGWNARVIEYLPDLTGPYADVLTLDDLSKMRGGLDWDEHYTAAFGITARCYYSDDVKSEMMERVAIVDVPGENFEYQSGATQLMAYCLEIATGKTLSDLASEWLWTPMGATDDAEWHTDDIGNELAYCCLNSNARDFGRLGHILLHNGYWRNHLYMDSAGVYGFMNPISTPFYGRSIWLGEMDGHPYSTFRGKNGQFIIIVPELNAVIVRLGNTAGPMLDPEMNTLTVVDALVRYYSPLLESRLTRK